MVVVWSGAGLTKAGAFSTVVIAAVGSPVFVALTLSVAVAVSVMGTGGTTFIACCEALRGAFEGTAGAAATCWVKNATIITTPTCVTYALASRVVVVSVFGAFDTVHSWVTGACMTFRATWSLPYITALSNPVFRARTIVVIKQLSVGCTVNTVLSTRAGATVRALAVTNPTV